MKIAVKVDNKHYFFDSSNPLTYEELKEFEIGTLVWCDYSNDWGCKVNNEPKVIVRDENEIDLRGSFCCVGDLKNTISRTETTIKVYELKETVQINVYRQQQNIQKLLDVLNNTSCVVCPLQDVCESDNGFYSICIDLQRDNLNFTTQK
ncbi:TPA: hypothetical protein LA460_000077 [Clostridium botulinum]|nr:hypothetical protein [Clostridium botulinum]HBJ1652682.1 hypothetical protein [Clostridium botulinum]